MNVLLVYQDEKGKTNSAAEMLKEKGHSPQIVSRREMLENRDGLPDADLAMVFSELYREQETRRLCEELRDIAGMRDTPLLVALNMYQMPLANRVKAMPNSYYIFTPLKPEDLDERLRMIEQESGEFKETK